MTYYHNIALYKMEELFLPGLTSSNPKNSTSHTTSLLHTIYTYSSRYIPLPDKQKPQSLQQSILLHQPFYKQAKQRITIQYQQLTNYINALQHKFLQVNRNQLDFLSDKHRYFLRKFKKFLYQHKKLLDVINNLDQIILQSQPVQQEIKSINFIKMISAQTDSKLQVLKENVLRAETQKAKNHKQIEDLKEKLNKLKTQYFAKKRQELQIKTQIQQKEQIHKEKQVENTMKKIRVQKRNKESFELKKQILLSQTQYSAQRWMQMPKSYTRSNESNMDTTLVELRNINSINENYIKKLSQTCENFKSKKLQDRKKINSKVISQTDLQNLRIKSRQDKRFRQSNQQQLLKNQQIIKQLTITNRLKEQLRQKKPQELLVMVIKRKKLKELLMIIDEVKMQEMKQQIIEKRKVNMARSQAYKKSTNGGGVVGKVVVEGEGGGMGGGVVTIR